MFPSAKQGKAGHGSGKGITFSRGLQSEPHTPVLGPCYRLVSAA